MIIQIPANVLGNNVPQPVSKFFEAIFSTLEINSIIVIEYHLQTNSRDGHSNSSVTSRSYHLFSKHQIDRSVYLLPLTNAYNLQLGSSIKMAPSSLASTQTPYKMSIVGMRVSSALDDDIVSPVSKRLDLISHALYL